MLIERPGMAEEPQQQMGGPVVKLEKELPWGRTREDPSPETFACGFGSSATRRQLGPRKPSGSSGALSPVAAARLHTKGADPGAASAGAVPDHPAGVLAWIWEHGPRKRQGPSGHVEDFTRALEAKAVGEKGALGLALLMWKEAVKNREFDGAVGVGDMHAESPFLCFRAT